MIDIDQESMIRISEVPKLLPPRSTGKRIHISAVYRWTQRGIRGVKLESVKIGGTTYTSKEALQRFAERLSDHAEGGDEARPKTKSRQRQIDRATKRVEEILGRNKRS